MKMDVLEGRGVDLTRMTAAMKTRAKARIRQSAARIKSVARQRAPRDTGALAKSYEVVMYRDSLGGKVRSRDPKAHLIEFGTAAHDVTVESKKVLAGGGQVYGKTVRIPAQQARPHLGPAADAEFPNLERDLITLLGDAIDGAV